MPASPARRREKADRQDFGFEGVFDISSVRFGAQVDEQRGHPRRYESLGDELVAGVSAAAPTAAGHEHEAPRVGRYCEPRGGREPARGDDHVVTED
jgi:hypothetical protein